jgi:adenine phosphoribosyltransferase
LEYGSDALEISKSVLNRDHQVLIVDDVLATGGTITAASKLIDKTGARVTGAICLLEIAGLPGANRLQQAGISSQCLLRM